MPPRRRLACTIVAQSQLALARVMARSFREHEPSASVVALLIDGAPRGFDAAAEPFQTVLTDALDNLPERARFFFQYGSRELAAALKPYFLEWLFAREGECDVVFLACDSWVLADFGPLWTLLAERSPVLTPQRLAPAVEDRDRGELEILQAGLYNLGFLGLREGEDTRRLLTWWQRRLLRDCRIDPARGTYLDQRWMDLIPLYFPQAAVLRDPGWNVGPWNLAERELGEEAGTTRAGGYPLRCLRVGESSSSEPERAPGAQREESRPAPELERLLARHRSLLLAAGHERTRKLPYGLGCFADGTPIPHVARCLYFELREAVARFGNPFAGSGEDSFRHWLTRPSTDAGHSELTIALHSCRSDLLAAFPDARGADAARFLSWLHETGAREFGLDPALLPPRELPPAPAAQPPREPSLRPTARELLTRVPGLRSGVRHIRAQLRAAARALPTRPWQRTAATPPFGINLAGFSRSPHAAGEWLRGQQRALDAAGVSVALFDAVDARSARQGRTALRVAAHNPYAVNLVHVGPEQLPLFEARVGPAWFADRHTIGAWPWELAQFPARWIERAARLDEVWVASHFAQDALARVLPVPVVRIPPALQPSPELAPLARTELGLAPRDFAFLFALDLADHTERLNPLGLIEAFRSAFSRDEPVALLIQLARPEFAPAQAARIRDAAKAAGVRILEGALPRPRLLGLLSACDAYISLHHSEGFGLTLAEAMALGRPTIATGYSGNLEFMTPANSLLVDFEPIELEHDSGPYAKGSRWAQPCLAHAAHCMRRLASDRDFAASLGARGSRDVRAQLDPKEIGARALERLRAIMRLRGWSQG